ncbi:hypothetical protein ABL78_8239 [Leptomonas seymouri]|uniref:Transmembrane protein n=1 Tax=Leptomonas seymouri TaxID=5684 RepID=A0A0N0P2P4_LEPSE|nr:hypothetical protein ABL78_8239 [Leptomonas seymouri]|eukprot:KPI82747.1 hypothetical protein ABL78_8239 [Leptomonas seymouri]
MSAGASAFVGFAYYSTNGDGFVYAPTSPTASTTHGTPVVSVSDVNRASNFFQFFFLVVGSVVMIVLLVLVSITFCCQRQVVALEKRYWRLKHVNAEVSNALVGEILQRTPVKQQSLTRSSSNVSSTNSHQQQQQQLQMQPRASAHHVSQQPAPMVSPYAYLQTSNAVAPIPSSICSYPPYQPLMQPPFPGARAHANDYNSMYQYTPATQPSEVSSASPSVSPDGLRRRASKVSFVDTN